MVGNLQRIAFQNSIRRLESHHSVSVSTLAITEIPETSTFESENAALHNILKKLPDKDHRSILSQLMIMTNARGPLVRIKLAVQVQDALLASMETNGIKVDSNDAVRSIFHLARLKKEYRVLFGKYLFKAMSKMYKREEKQKENEVKREKTIPGRSSLKESPQRTPKRKSSKSENVEADVVESAAATVSLILSADKTGPDSSVLVT